MFVVKYQGGLGNQMFQYAFYKQLMQHYPENKVRGYVGKISDHNGYEIEKVFNVCVEKVDWKTASRLACVYPVGAPLHKLLSIYYKINLHKYGYKQSHIIQDDNTCFYPEVFKLNTLQSYYFDGVWANVKYFENIRDELLQDFTFKYSLTGNNLRLSEKMKCENSVSIHVRRSDYITRGLRITSDSYYKRAIDLIKSKIMDPVFYVFSDDHEYCEQLFSNLIDFTLVKGNAGSNSFKDMQLMTCCKHNIIANSTFSFWGAYLGDNDDKTVIAPNISYDNAKCPFACEDWCIINAK